MRSGCWRQMEPVFLRKGVSLIPESGELVIDLSALGYIDSSGLHGLIEVAKAAASRDARLVLSAPTHPVRRLLDLVAIDDVPGIVRR